MDSYRGTGRTWRGVAKAIEGARGGRRTVFACHNGVMMRVAADYACEQLRDERFSLSYPSMEVRLADGGVVWFVVLASVSDAERLRGVARGSVHLDHACKPWTNEWWEASGLAPRLA